MKSKIFYIIALIFVSIGLIISVISMKRNIKPYVNAYKPRATHTTKIKTEISKTKEIDKEIQIVAVGDILLGRGVEKKVRQARKDFVFPFEKVSESLQKGDIIFGNLEASITSSTHTLTGIKQKGKYIIKNSVDSFTGIKYAGFNLLSLANNHILDCYEKGLFDTMKLLQNNNIAYSGAGKNIDEARKPAIIEKKGVKVGMISYTDMAYVTYSGNPPLSFIATSKKAGVAPREMNLILEDVAKLKPEVDLVIVSLHWGVEESFEVLSKQREFAYKLLDSGVDIILGHHPHQFQGVEIYKGKPIIYSLGNFIFDQNDPENQESFILNMNYKNNKLIDMNLTPIRTIDKMQINLIKGVDTEALLAREIKLCKSLGTICNIENDKIIFGGLSNNTEKINTK